MASKIFDPSKVALKVAADRKVFKVRPGGLFRALAARDERTKEGI